MEPADKKLYWEKGEKQEIKANGLSDFISKMKKIKSPLLFMKDRAEEVLIYRKRIVEAKTLDDLNQVKALIINRISLVNDKNIRDYPEVKQTLKELKILLKYVDAEITAFKPEVNDKRKNSKPKFSHTYIALKCFYKRIEITKNNADRIAKIYGYVAPNSGKKLKDQYDNHRTVQSRTNYPGTKKFKNMVNDLESIIKDLPQKKWKQENPIEELDKLRRNSEQYLKKPVLNQF